MNYTESGGRLPTVTEDSILGFFGQYRFLSNFHPVWIEADDGLNYPSVEHAYMAQKTEDLTQRLWFASPSLTPTEAKKMGRKVTLRPGWDDMRLRAMRNLLEKKFSKPGLKELLLSTSGKYLEETNDWGDKFWGVCGGVGENHLGVLLMSIRNSLQAASTPGS